MSLHHWTEGNSNSLNTGTDSPPRKDLHWLCVGPGHWLAVARQQTVGQTSFCTRTPGASLLWKVDSSQSHHSHDLLIPHQHWRFFHAEWKLQDKGLIDYLQYPLTIFPATTLAILSQAFSEPSTGAPRRTTSSTTPSLPANENRSLLNI